MACEGTLVVHTDGTPLWCSEEFDGRTCGDYSLRRHRAFESCRTVFVRGCSTCQQKETAPG